uniref:Ig-like domain-containing protein n=1 Tax=Strigamia maritima TaxID=126957 RepID=T1IHA2_STRMM
MCQLKQLLLFALFLRAMAEYDDQNDGPKVFTEGTNTTVRKGYPLRLHCGIDFDKEAFLVMWMNGSEFITAGETVMKYVDKINIHMSGIDLEIISAQPEDTGVYTCSVSSTTRESQTHIVNVIYLQNMELQPKKASIDVKVGTIVDLKCTADGNPKPVAEWFHNGKRIEKAKFVDSTGEMTVDHMKPHDAGTYECRMDNQSGERLNKSIRVNVIASAQVMKKPENGKISVMSGDNVKLNCQVDGQGQMKIHWYFKGEQLSGKSGEEFQLENAKYSDAGTYKCKVMTEVFRNMEANFSVEVLHVPHIKCNNLHIHTGEGRSINVICFVTADPEPMDPFLLVFILAETGSDRAAKDGITRVHCFQLETVTWQRDGHTLLPSHKISLLRDASTKKYELKIRKIRSIDFGHYIIVARNDIGMATERITLTGLPTAVTVKLEGEPEVNTKIKFSTKSFSQIFHFELNYRQVKALHHQVRVPVPVQVEVKRLECIMLCTIFRGAYSASKSQNAAAVESAPTLAPGSALPTYKAASLVSILTIVILVIFFC